MITWIIGTSNSGKTTLAKRIPQYHKNTIVLDADEIRRIVRDSDYGHYLQSLAYLAKIFSKQGFDVAVAAIVTTEEYKSQITEICNPEWINLNELSANDNNNNNKIK